MIDKIIELALEEHELTYEYPKEYVEAIEELGEIAPELADRLSASVLKIAETDYKQGWIDALTLIHEL